MLNRRSSIIEVLQARIPHHTEKFVEECKKAVSFDKLLVFIEFRTTLLKSIQLPQKEKTQTIKIHATETREVKNKQFGPKTFAQELSTSPKKVQSEMERCSYCQSAHPFAQCNRLLTMSLPERVDAVVKLRCCFHCGSNEHGAKDCPDKKNVICSLCNRRGHIAIFHGRPALFKQDGQTPAPRRGGKQPIGFETTIITNPDAKRDAAAEEQKSGAPEEEENKNPSI